MGGVRPAQHLEDAARSIRPSDAALEGKGLLRRHRLLNDLTDAGAIVGLDKGKKRGE